MFDLGILKRLTHIVDGAAGYSDCVNALNQLGGCELFCYRIDVCIQLYFMFPPINVSVSRGQRY